MTSDICIFELLIRLWHILLRMAAGSYGTVFFSAYTKKSWRSILMFSDEINYILFLLNLHIYMS